MQPNLRGSKDFLAGLLFLAIGAGAIIVAIWRQARSAMYPIGYI